MLASVGVDVRRTDPTQKLAQSRVGAVLGGRWTLLRVIGVGGSACVYEARHRNGSRVAVKVLHPEHARDSHQRARFFSEGLAANRVMHPGVVAVLDEGEEPDGTAFLVMELLSGESLDRAAQARGRLPWREVAEAAAAILDILASAHDRHVVHRDLKPSNVFRCSAGAIKLLDFGAAKVHDGHFQQLTRSGTTIGTPAFMAPELASGIAEEVDARSDLWAVGATMFQLLSGRPVHVAASANQALVFAATRPAPRLRSVCSDVPSQLAALVDRALSYDKTHRFPNARSMQAGLLDVLGLPSALELGATTDPEALVGRALPRAKDGRHRTTASLLLLLAIGGGAWAALHARTPAEQPKTPPRPGADSRGLVASVDTPHTSPEPRRGLPASMPALRAAAPGHTEPPVDAAPLRAKPSQSSRRSVQPSAAVTREQSRRSDDSDSLLDRWQ